jgi:FtsP/CotA-like multicopper oxidase with cupredoxin domain
MKNKRANIEKSIHTHEQKKKRTTNDIAGFIGLLLIAGVLFSILILSGSAADTSNSTSSDNSITVSSANNSFLNADAVQVNAKKEKDNKVIKKMKEEPALRKDAAARFKAARDEVLAAGGMLAMPHLDPGGIPHYFGPYPNYANSPLPTGSVANITLATGGSNYTSPAVMVHDIYVDVYGAGTGANVTATVINGVITNLTLNNGGSGYTMGSTPMVTITDTTGSGATATATIGGPTQGGIRKFVDSLPLLGPTGANNLGQYIPVAVAENRIFSNESADYYEIALVEYAEKMHTDLPPTTHRGYVQLSTSGSGIPLNYLNGSPILIGGVQAYAVDNPHFLGPAIIAQKDKPVRVKFYNLLPTGSGGDLFLPVDTTVMGAGHYDINFDPATKEPLGTNLNGMFTENRGTIHLHGGFVPWISDGTPHQWTTPAGEATSYPEGVSVYNVPDMPDPGDGSMTFYYNNDQSARLMFYHDHSFGITRLNVYAGEAAPYLLSDQVEKDMIAGTNVTGVNPAGAQVLPDTGIPLVIQDRTFVDSTTIAAQDPTWKWGTTPPVPNTGDLWYPHVYMPNQNPADPSGMNAFGRWHYGPWFWPPTTGITYPPIPNPYYDPVNASWEPPLIPATPNPSEAAEAFMDTPVVNGAVYPYLEVEPKTYRFRILNAADDRFFNLQLYEADPLVLTADGRNNTEVKMVPAIATTGFPADWPIDGREGGVPDPFTAGPSFIQIGSEGGFLPEPVMLPNQPVDWNMDQTNFDMGVVNKGTLILGTAERADVIVDFSAYAGKTLILYNDAPAPFPAIDPRYDYHTGNADHTDMGGAPTTQAGYGPNTRTIMQIRVNNTTASASYDVNALKTVFAKTNTKRGVFEVSQDQVIVPQANYNSAYNMNFPADTFMRIDTQSTSYFDFISGSPLTSLKLTNGGIGYTSPPTVTISAPTNGTTATANATLAPRSVASVTVTNGGNSYTSAPTVGFSGGGGTGAAATAALAPTGVVTITVTNGGRGYTSAPTVNIIGGGGTGATAIARVQGNQVRSVTVTNAGSGYTFAPTVTFTGGGGTGATATAVLAPSVVASVTVTSKGSGYTSAPTVSFIGGGGTGAAATAALGPAAIASLNLINGGSGYTSAPTVTFTGGGGSGAAAVAIGILIPFEPKAIQDEMGEAFDNDYGRMTAMLGLELPNAAAGAQDFILVPFLSAPVDIIGAPVGTLGDGIQVWRITHNGVDTHTIHFHLFNAQIINRVAWDNAIRPPDLNEMGWKETFRINPLQDTFVAFKPVAPTQPFKIPNSIRPLDPTMPLGDPLAAPTGGWKDTAGNPVTVSNHLVNFGWEYLYHCHLLAHEEFDMMHSVILGVTPDAPITPAAVQSGNGNNQRVILTWTDNSMDEVSFKVQRATAATGPWTTIATVTSSTGPGTGGTETYTDTTVVRRTTYYYRILATNVVGDTTLYPAPAIGFPTVSYDSTPSITVTATTV